MQLDVFTEEQMYMFPFKIMEHIRDHSCCSTSHQNLKLFACFTLRLIQISAITVNSTINIHARDSLYSCLKMSLSQLVKYGFAVLHTMYIYNCGQCKKFISKVFVMVLTAHQQCRNTHFHILSPIFNISQSYIFLQFYVYI